MRRTFAVVRRALTSVWLFELVAAGLFVAGAAVLLGAGAALITGGVMAGLKSYELGE